MFYAVVINPTSCCDMEMQRCHGIKVEVFMVYSGQSQRDAKHLQLSLNSSCSKSIQQVFFLSFMCAVFSKKKIPFEEERKKH